MNRTAPSQKRHVAAARMAAVGEGERALDRQVLAEIDVRKRADLIGQGPARPVHVARLGLQHPVMHCPVVPQTLGGPMNMQNVASGVAQLVSLFFEYVLGDPAPARVFSLSSRVLVVPSVMAG